MKKLILIAIFAFFPLFAKQIISVSIPPQAYFVEKIAGKDVEINVIISPATDEHNVDFKPQIMAKLEKSALYFTAGLEFEKAMLSKFKNIFKNAKIINSNENIKLLPAAYSHHENHTHYHDDFDPHTWLDPILVKTQAENIARALSEKFPQNAEIYAANLAKFQTELDELDAKIKALLNDKKNKKFIVYHPSWSYFAKRYNLEQIAVEIDGKEPKVRDLKALIKLAKKEKIRTIFIQKGFPQKASQSLAKELKAEILELDHLARDWQNELEKSAKALARD